MTITYIAERHDKRNNSTLGFLDKLPQNTIILAEFHDKVKLDLNEGTPLYYLNKTIQRNEMKLKVEFVDIRYDIPFMYHHCLYSGFVGKEIPYTQEEKDKLSMIELKMKESLPMKEFLKLGKEKMYIEMDKDARIATVLDSYKSIFWGKLSSPEKFKEYMLSFYQEDDKTRKWERDFFLSKGFPYQSALLSKRIEESPYNKKIRAFVSHFYNKFPWNLWVNDALSHEDFINLADCLYMDIHVALMVLETGETTNYAYVAGETHIKLMKDILAFCKTETILENINLDYITDPFIKEGGNKKYIKYNHHRFVVRNGSRGGKYILVKGRKVYI